MQSAQMAQPALTHVNSESHRDAIAVSVVNSVGLSVGDLAIAMLEQSRDCIKLLSVDGHLEFMNCNGRAAMEIDHPEMVIGKLWWELWPESAQEFVRQKFGEALQGRETEFEAECPTAKGAMRRWVVNLRPLSAKAGPIVSILSTSRDITDQPR